MTTKITMQDIMCNLWKQNPGATDEEVCQAIWDGGFPPPQFNYTVKRVQTDRNKYNKAIFKCQEGIIPERPAYNPAKTTAQLQLNLV